MARLILCTLRHFSAAQSLETAALAAQFQGTLVAGLGIAGNEALALVQQGAMAHRDPCRISIIFCQLSSQKMIDARKSPHNDKKSKKDT